MGLWDVVQRLLRGRAASPPAAANPAEGALARRRMAQGLTRRGKPLSAYRLRNYERLERAITLKVGRFPWTKDEARAAMLGKGIDPAAAQAYLDSSAARKLLE